MNTVAIVGTGPDWRFFRAGAAPGGIPGRHSGRQLRGRHRGRAWRRAPSTAGCRWPKPCRKRTWYSSRRPSDAFSTALRHLDPLVRPGALITDAGSTKCEIVDAATQHISRCQFLGGHPMAGKEKRGAAAAEATCSRAVRGC